jgi:hypothetical protein
MKPDGGCHAFSEIPAGAVTVDVGPQLVMLGSCLRDHPGPFLVICRSEAIKLQERQQVMDNSLAALLLEFGNSVPSGVGRLRQVPDEAGYEHGNHCEPRIGERVHNRCRAQRRGGDGRGRSGSQVGQSEPARGGQHRRQASEASAYRQDRGQGDRICPHRPGANPAGKRQIRRCEQ